MVSTRTMSNVTSGGESSAGPSRCLRHHTVVPDKSNINLMQLPQEVLEHILSFLPYRTVGNVRQVCRRMDFICGGILNLKFQQLQTCMLGRFQAIKSQMPRRESARRSHPLACESDIIETLHMRLTLLQMSFGKHIERKHCCFFPGEILDEVDRILHYIKVTQKLGRPYRVTDELFDLSTMAMEYFKESIEPNLPEIAYFSTEFLNEYASQFTAYEDSATASISGSTKSEDTVSSGPPQSNMVLRKRIRRIKQGMKRYNNQLSVLRRDLRALKSLIAEQQKQICDYTTRLDDCDKKSEETTRKFSTVLQELNKCKTELQYWRSKAPASFPPCNTCGKGFMPQINEDLAVLANQGVLPWIQEAVEDEGLPGPSNVDPPEAVKLVEMSGSKINEAGPSGLKEPKVAPMKRKMEDTSPAGLNLKKTKRRAIKSRRK